jgi:glycosyltransferase involved in cell wall biosynthesis
MNSMQTIAVPPSVSAMSLEPVALTAIGKCPLVSILVGNYNYANYIRQTIESVLHQTYTKWELIICDDGSTDQSIAVIGPYLERDHRIRLLRKSNGGHTSALNAAFAVCRGDLVCLLDSDDLFLPAKLERVTQACEASPQKGVIVHRVIRVNEFRRRQGVWPLSNSLPDGWYGPDLLRSGGILPYTPPTSGLTLRREIAVRLFPLPTSPPLHMCPDQVLMRLAPLMTEVGSLPEALAEYRLHRTNTYGHRTVSAHSIDRELELSQALWDAQYQFLSNIKPEIAAELVTLDHNCYAGLLRYLRAKLRRDPTAREYHRCFLALSQQHGRPKWYSFWHYAPYIPASLFRVMANVLLGQGVLKQIVARLKGLS